MQIKKMKMDLGRGRRWWRAPPPPPPDPPLPTAAGPAAPRRARPPPDPPQPAAARAARPAAHGACCIRAGRTAAHRVSRGPRRDAFPCSEVVERGGDRGDGRGGGGATGRQLDWEREGGVTPSDPPRSR